MTCIFCESEISKSPIEHIVPESLGNLWYTLPPNKLCDSCNNDFSEFEHKAISKTQLGFIRTKNGIKTKKGKPASFEIGNIRGEGLESSEKNVLTFYGLEDKDIVGVNTKDNTFQIKIPDFHKSEMATSKMLLKMAYESLYKSNKELFLRYDFSNLLKYILKADNKDWPFLSTGETFYPFKSIPKFLDRHNLNKIKCKLGICEVSNETVLFEFKYDYIALVINLLNRDYSWTKIYFEKAKFPGLYPQYLTKP